MLIVVLLQRSADVAARRSYITRPRCDAETISPANRVAFSRQVFADLNSTINLTAEHNTVTVPVGAVAGDGDVWSPLHQHWPQNSVLLLSLLASWCICRPGFIIIIMYLKMTVKWLCWCCDCFLLTRYFFNDLTLLVWHQQRHLKRKKSQKCFLRRPAVDLVIGVLSPF